MTIRDLFETFSTINHETTIGIWECADKADGVYDICYKVTWFNPAVQFNLDRQIYHFTFFPELNDVQITVIKEEKTND